MTEPVSPRRSKLLRMLDDFWLSKSEYIKKPTAKNQTSLKFSVEQIEKHFENGSSEEVLADNYRMRTALAMIENGAPEEKGLIEQFAALRLEIMQVRAVAMELSIALAKRCLLDANEATRETGEWPGEQSWTDLVGTSQSIMRRRGYTESGLDEHKVVKLLFDAYGDPKQYDTAAVAIAIKD